MILYYLLDKFFFVFHSTIIVFNLFKGFHKVVATKYRDKSIPTVLIVDREPQFREACKSALRQAGFRVIDQPDIVDGLQLLDGVHPNLIVWDLHPKKIVEMKALSVLREKYGDVALVLMVPDKELYDALSKMADAVLVKSNQMADLLAKIAELLKKRPLDEQKES